MYITDDGVLRHVNEKDISYDGKLIIPDGVKIIGENFLSKKAKSEITTIKIPNSVVQIEDDAFSDCKLEEIYIPDSVKEIGKNVFSHCVRLSKVRLPNGLKVIPEGLFNDASVDYLEIPDSVEVIGPFAFNSCYIGGVLKLSNNLRQIQKFAFSGSTLNYIDIPKSVEIIDSGAFLDCSYLKSISLSEGLLKIKSEAFHDCNMLKEIIVPDSVFEIGDSAFEGCKNLKVVKLPKNLKFIDSKVFLGSGLEKIVLPNSVGEIKEYAFSNCDKLKQVELSNNIKKIENNVFENCYNLEFVNFPKGIISIGDMSFANCRSLVSINLPSTLKSVGNSAFEECKKLAQVNLSEGIEIIGERCFNDCNSLTKLVLPKSLKKVGNNSIPFGNKTFILKLNNSTIFFPSATKKRVYLIKQADGDFVVSNKRIDSAIPLDYNDQLKLGAIIALYEQLDKFRSFTKKVPQEILIYSLYGNITNEQFIDLFNNADTKFYNKVFKEFLKRLDNNGYRAENIVSFCKLMYNLGVFDGEIEEVLQGKNGIKTVKTYPAQKVGECLIEAIKEGILDSNKFYIYFGNMAYDGNKSDFTKLFLNKQSLKNMIDYNNDHQNFISNSYNEFKKIQDRNKSNKGSQRQLHITYDMLVQYSQKRKFGNQTQATEKVAEVVSRFFTKQETFDFAVSVMKEKEEMGIPDSLTKVHIKEQDAFDSITSHMQNIEQKSKETLQILTDLMTKEFTYEWLKKNDPYNLVLGKLCDCCAHLEGEGVGIMRASIIHPNIQNMVIKDKNGEIVAKATLYINPQEGYGVFNTISVSKEVLTFIQPEIIYTKFKRGLNAFAEQYNIENPDKPLKILTVGENMNKLIEQIKKNDRKSDVLYKSIYYGDYSINKSAYEGDSSTSQYVVWEDKNNGR